MQKSTIQSPILGGLFDIEKLEREIAEYDAQMSESSFWDNSQEAQEIIKSANHLKETFESYNQLNQRYEDSLIMEELLEEDNDEELKKELENSLDILASDVDDLEVSLLLDDKYDANNAIVEIQSGAGGTEAQDWVSMLFRMYTRYIESMGFKLDIVDYHSGEEAGTKNVTFMVKGHNAYGYMKSEKGVHRLIRLSPFDSQNRRHTSFVSVEVTPEINEDIEVEIKNDDLRIDTYRASGAGGQHINKTDSAVRITHEPTGIVVASQEQRSQIQNKETAMSMLKSKLYQLEVEKKELEMADIVGEQKDIGWGSQIRSYIFHPYSLVKDHRTNVESGNVNTVMDGEIQPFVEAYLRWSKNSSYLE